MVAYAHMGFFTVRINVELNLYGELNIVERKRGEKYAASC